ncbi:class I SAM-dependent methyltransferase [Methylomicrobium sp. RS1]|jgi:SAM-dependent methyltransferase|uniref:class I SAM-dependent methyltransferase n=1 Tax=Candidatus Methylomicrobium oryzae TaxID=2802053 RepID=UPI001921BA49|nr:class I SAM-dependent methyltransferase [Methylomicrobium sp. RS1]MBL1264886.1 class I SAM-dependent methyltransferase [Methylomicrobium sp. RS1]
MRILVAITNYGTKNIEYAKRIIQEYRSMPFKVDIFVLSEAPKDYGSDISVLVGLPTKDPWSLPFGHKRLFAENIESYDLFIYTEDDMLIRKDNILAFLKASETIGSNFLPGFVQYELYPNGKKSYLQAHGPFHWIPDSVKRFGEYTFAEFSNAHSACYILTQAQLRKALASGGFLVAPHSGRYDLLCSASTDPYIQCGFTRVICLSHLQEFELHHLPNAYLNRTGLISNNSAGLHEDGYKLQIAALLEILDQKRSHEELFTTQKPLATLAWDKSYYELCRNDIVRLIPSYAKEILSVGVSWGATESYLLENDKRVVAIPLDSVIGRLAEERGIRVLPPDFGQAFELLIGSRFDAIVVSDVLQHIPNPVEILEKLGSLLRAHGVIVGSIPNLNFSRRLCGRLRAKSNRWAELRGEFNNIGLNLTNSLMLKRWLKASNLYPLEVRYEAYNSFPLIPKFVASHLSEKLVASNIVFVANRRHDE